MNEKLNASQYHVSCVHLNCEKTTDLFSRFCMILEYIECIHDIDMIKALLF